MNVMVWSCDVQWNNDSIMAETFHIPESREQGDSEYTK